MDPGVVLHYVRVLCRMHFTLSSNTKSQGLLFRKSGRGTLDNTSCTTVVVVQSFA